MSGSSGSTPSDSTPSGSTSSGFTPSDSTSIETQLQQIAHLGQTGQLAAAKAQCQQLLQHHPDLAKAWDLLGLITLQQGQPQEALSYVERAIELNDQSAEFFDHVGVIQSNLGNVVAGIAAYRQSLCLAPDAVHTRYNLGLALARAGRLAEAQQTFLSLIAQQPTYALAHHQLGNLYQQQQHWTDAIAHYRQAIELQPQAIESWYNLGVALQQSGEFTQSFAAYQQAVALNPRNGQALNGLGTLLEKQGQFAAALQHYQQALTLQPHYIPALMNLGNLQVRQEQLATAAATFSQILQLDPQHPQALDNLIKVKLRRCDWANLTDDITRFKVIVHHSLSQNLPCDITPLNSLFLPFSATEQQAIAQNRAQNILKKMGNFRQNSPPALESQIDSAGSSKTQNPKSKIRLGYVSGDFRYHAMGHLVLQLFELHDRSQFEVFAYSLGPDDGSNERQKFIADSDCFRDISQLTPVQSAQRIQQDAIDILIDLMGYTDYACPEIFALRPAPLQINYLGYPGTLGASYIDYIITDPILTPPELAPYFTEHCLYLPDTYQLNSYQALPPIASSPPPHSSDFESKDLESEHFDSEAQQNHPQQDSSPFIFCCFNKCEKIEPRIFATWMQILAQVPHSVLWLLSDRPDTETNLKAAAQAQGIDPARLVFVPRLPKAEHLDRHTQVDLFLDTLYYNAHVTASDALWAGTPVLTMLGNTFAARVAASLLTAAGLSDLITHSLEEYTHLAIHLATHPEDLHRFKAKLTAHPADLPLFNTQRTVRHLEAGYHLIWQRHQAGLPPTATWVDRDSSSPSPSPPLISSHSRFSIPDSQALNDTITCTITCTIDDGFCQWLSQANGSLLLTTYRSGQVILVGWNGQQVTLLPRQFSQPMSMAIEGNRFALATESEVLLFANAPLLGADYPEANSNQYDALYVPRATYFTGNLMLHDLAYGTEGLWLVNTRFSCLVQLSADFSFVPRWQPPFITQLTPDDRCHLNGVAMVDGKPKYVTALGATDTPRGWSLHKATGGIVMDTETNEILLQGLALPHSPRWHQERLWLLNSGAGELWQIEPQTRQHQVVATLPGFGRGLALVDRYALVGLSQIRESHLFSGLPIQQRFDRLLCGVVVVDLQTGRIIGKLEFSQGCQELYNVVFLPGKLRPMLLNLTQSTMRPAIVTPDYAC